ncbi:MAG: nitroreductase family deazaflavin-dependent oxidoreductase [Acidimicrobiia bacterium]|nr:nitroreductase family deazaflavin-dependent oxidoreductase [Acidimicrobiia bacterium]
MASESTAARAAKKPFLPPRWFIRTAWRIHRALYRVTGGRFGLRRPNDKTYGLMRVVTIGRRSGVERPVMLGYFEDGANLVTMAMNGWGAPEPAWWLNVQAHRDVTIDLVGETRRSTGRAATGAERERLWARWQEIDRNLDDYAARRPTETAVVVFESQPGDQAT